jgi:hypothetical protein
VENGVEKLESFLEAWKNEDWNGMWKNSQKTWRCREGNNAERLFDLFGHKKLESYEIIGLDEVSDCCVDIEVSIKYFIEARTKIQVATIRPRLLNEIKEYTPSIDGEWGVNPISMLKEH